MALDHLGGDNLPRAQHLEHVAGHVAGQRSIARERFGDERELVLLGNPEIDREILAALRPLRAQAGVEPADLLQHRAPDQRRAAIADEIAPEDVLQHLAVGIGLMLEAGDAAVRIDPRIPGIGEPRPLPTRIERFKLARDLRGRPEIIGVDKGDQIGRRRSPSHVARRRHTGIGLPHHADARIDRGMRQHRFDRAVARAVIDHDDLELGVGLRAHAAQCLIDRRLAIISRDDHAHEPRVGPIDAERPVQAIPNRAAQRGIVEICEQPIDGLFEPFGTCRQRSRRAARTHAQSFDNHRRKRTCLFVRDGGTKQQARLRVSRRSDRRAPQGEVRRCLIGGGLRDFGLRTLVAQRGKASTDHPQSIGMELVQLLRERSGVQPVRGVQSRNGHEGPAFDRQSLPQIPILAGPQFGIEAPNRLDMVARNERRMHGEAVAPGEKLPRIGDLRTEAW